MREELGGVAGAAGGGARRGCQPGLDGGREKERAGGVVRCVRGDDLDVWGVRGVLAGD